MEGHGRRWAWMGEDGHEYPVDMDKHRWSWNGHVGHVWACKNMEQYGKA